MVVVAQSDLYGNVIISFTFTFNYNRKKLTFCVFPDKGRSRRLLGDVTPTWNRHQKVLRRSVDQIYRWAGTFSAVVRMLVYYTENSHSETKLRDKIPGKSRPFYNDVRSGFSQSMVLCRSMPGILYRLLLLG